MWVRGTFQGLGSINLWGLMTNYYQDNRIYTLMGRNAQNHPNKVLKSDCAKV